MGHGWLKHIYDRLPVPAQNLAVSLTGWRKRRLRLEREFREHMDFLLRTQRMCAEEVRAWQEAALRRLLEEAVRNVPGYAAAAAIMGRGSVLDRLAELPVLPKEAVRATPERYRSACHASRNVIKRRTSGTTGSPLDVWLTREAHRREYAHWWFHRSWVGVNLGDRIATLAGHQVVPIDRKRPPFCRFNRAENQLIFSSYHMSSGNLRYYVEDLTRFKPELIQGYPSSIYLLAYHMAEHGGGPIRPKAVITSSETLLDYQRELIEARFGCKVFSFYANTETTVAIAECPSGSHHVQPTYGVAEFLDSQNKPVSAGQPGRLIGTGLNNHAMPLIRYDTGDIAVPREGACPCGRAGRLVWRIEGRAEDYVVTADGRLVGRLDHIFKGMIGVVAAQLVQDRAGELLIRVVPGDGFGPARAEQIKAAARERLGEGMKIDVEQVASIPRSGTGKFRSVISEPGRRRLQGMR